MTGERRALTFSGILTHPFDLPGYLSPVFENRAGQRFTQVPDAEERIAAFARLGITDERFRPVHSFPQVTTGVPGLWTRKIGSPLLVAFVLPQGDVLLGDPQDARGYLKERLALFEEHPMIQAGIADFCGDRQTLEAAEAREAEQAIARAGKHQAKRKAFADTCAYLRDADETT